MEILVCQRRPFLEKGANENSFSELFQGVWWFATAKNVWTWCNKERVLVSVFEALVEIKFVLTNCFDQSFLIAANGHSMCDYIKGFNSHSCLEETPFTCSDNYFNDARNVVVWPM